MALEVVGEGFGRTGTKSLKFALEMLGFDRCYHMIEVRNGRLFICHFPAPLAGWHTAATRYQSV